MSEDTPQATSTEVAPSHRAPEPSPATDAKSADVSESITTADKSGLARRGIIAGFLYFLVMWGVFSAWVHYYYAGYYSGPLFISTFFGLSEKSVEAGAHPVFTAPTLGWDGQFYYTQSNDPFLLDDYQDSTLFDNLPYRYQRNGLSMTARFLSMVTGNTVTTPYLFFITQMLFMSVGFGALVAFLHHYRQPWWWACIWGFYGGVVRPFAHGLPDPMADSLLLLAILSVVSGRIVPYVLASSLLCLCRESYAAPAAAIWLLTLTGRLTWQERGNWFSRVALTTLPGVTVLGWAFYVAHQTGSEILSGSRAIPWGGLIDWPFFAFTRCLWDDMKSGGSNDILYASSCMLCIVAVLVLCLQNLRKHWLAWAALPHVILMTMTGWIVWENGVGYFKNTSSLVLLGVMFVAWSPSKSLRAALIFTFLCALHYIYRVDLVHQGYLPPLGDFAVEKVEPLPTVVAPINEEFDYASKVELIAGPDDDEHTLESKNYSGLFSWCHRYPKLYTIRITNLSDRLWPATVNGHHAVSIGRQFLRGERVLQEDRTMLYKSVAPGESIDYRLAFPSGGGPGSGRISRIGVVHDGKKWFYWDDPEQALEFEY